MNVVPRRFGLGLIVVPVLALMATACGGEGTATEGGDGAAEEAGALVIYSGRDQELIDPLIEQMREATGLEIDVRYGDTAQMANQIVTEGENTNADLFIAQDAGALGLLVQEGALADLPAEVTDLVPEQYRDAGDQWVGISGRSRVIVVDPADVDEVPDSVLDLTDPEWEGRVGIAPTNASFQAFVTGLRVIEGEDAARQWLDDMVANDVQTFENNRSMLDALESGDIDLSLNNHYYWYERVKEQGADAVTSEVHYLPAGDAGGLVNVAGAGITADAANPEGALTALEFLLGEEAQTYFTQETSEYPLVAGVPLGEGLEELDSLEQPNIDLSDLHSLDETVEMLREAGLE
ncbi:iron ABC transporter substrate-binding protein [Nocardiopsis lambiniae]|uniref:Iron ABC transporter substrate-binding protein n=1 Tax=Nocardiopsis lambiniae TaxID=3075539 RepID=A0ABU2M7E3_9ACTN|nr:iron ABC transporter substrate-binding protein [Nocardiopsis sp. DSM 44743]MDT0328577.1 iron ABC transporter substrate-binding protein [Nocardiopsis sp. DSM 44743]